MHVGEVQDNGTQGICSVWVHHHMLLDSTQTIEEVLISDPS